MTVAADPVRRSTWAISLMAAVVGGFVTTTRPARLSAESGSRREPPGKRPPVPPRARPLERRERLAQRAPRKEPAVAPRVAPGDHDDLEVLRQRPVLESVVEDE